MWERKGSPEGLKGLSVGQAGRMEDSQPCGQGGKLGGRFPSSDTKLSHQTPQESNPRGPVPAPRFSYYTCHGPNQPLTEETVYLGQGRTKLLVLVTINVLYSLTTEPR